MTDLATMDTSVLDAEFVDTPAPDATGDTTDLATTDGGEGGEPTTDVETPTTEVAATGGNVLSVNGKITAATSTALATIKAQNPAVAAQLTRAAYAVEAFRAEFPGGLKEAREMKAQLAELENFGPIAQTRQELEGFREYDRQFMAGDPRFVETMIAADPAAFQKLAPSMFVKYSEVNPEGHGTLVAQSTMKDLMDSRVPMSLEMSTVLLDDLGQRIQAEAPGAVGLFNRLVQNFNSVVSWVQKVDAQSKKQVAAPEAAKPDQTQDNERISLLSKVWSADTGRSLAQKFQSEFTRLSAGRRFTTDQKADIQERFSMRLQKALEAIPGFEDRVSQYLRAGDQEGHLRYINSMYAQQVPRIMAALIKPAAPVAAKTASAPAPGTPAPTPIATGFQRISAMPKREEINWKLTDQKHIMADRAILNDGRRVQWG